MAAIRLALAYYGRYAAEIDDEITENARLADETEQAWLAANAVLA
jgi:hypothetical protein